MRILEVKTEHSAVIKSLVEVLKEIIQETNIEFRYQEDEDDEDNKNNKYIKILAVDTSKTILINCKLYGEKFTSFNCKKKKLSIGVNLTNLHKLIKSADKEDILTLYMDHDDKNSLKISLDNKETGKHSDVLLKLLDLGSTGLRVPTINFDSYIVMQCTEFHKLCREMSTISDFVEIKCLENKIKFTAKCDYGDKSVNYDNGNKVTIQFDEGDDEDRGPKIIQGIYELRTLSLFSKCSGLCTDIEIYMKNNYPLVIQYTVASLGKLLLCLAPSNIKTDDNLSEDEDEYLEDDIEII